MPPVTPITDHKVNFIITFFLPYVFISYTSFAITAALKADT